MKNALKAFYSFLIKNNLKIPKKYKAEFMREVVIDNSFRVAIVATFLFLFECVLFFFQKSLFFVGPIIIRYLIVLSILLPLIWYIRVKSSKVNIYLALFVQYAFAAASIIFGEVVALNVYSKADIIHIYLLMVFSSAAFISMKPLESFILLFSTYVYFIFLIPKYISDSNIIFSILINTGASIFIAWIIANILWRAKISVFLNKKALHKQNLRLIDLNKKDLMTGLYNHESSIKILKEETEKANSMNYPLSLIVADIDDFKNINDNYGHLVGDDVLKSLSKVLKNIVRKRDYVGRYGGEEFIIIMPETNINDAKLLAERIRSTIDESGFNNIHFTISGGVSQSYGQEAEELIKITDKKLYLAKEKGKNRFISTLD